MTSNPTPSPRPGHRPGPRRTSSPPPSPECRVLSARGPDDLLAAVPVVLGFQPHDSAVMLTFGGAHPFHARVDLPEPGDLAALADLLLEPAVGHGVRSVVLVLYTADEVLARRAAHVLERRFEACGLLVQAVLCADGERWWLPSGDRARATPYDLSLHPFRVQSVVDGQVTHTSRDELAATLDTEVEAAAVVAAAVPEARAFDAVDVAGCTAHHVACGTDLSDDELAGIAVAIEQPDVRDGAWTLITRASARDHVRVWSDAVRRTPPDLLGGPAAVLAFSAWLAGHGALAWCAVDRAREVDPDNSLARLVADLLSAAVPPTTWTDLHLDRDERGVL
ncbi:MAG: DUF4192 domain-containing protein [Nocardioides sp.]|nr:DUF4192 domain-containing protein [Nocardioides sp.]